MHIYSDADYFRRLCDIKKKKLKHNKQIDILV